MCTSTTTDTPSHMLAALAGWTPEDILAAREIRQVRADKLDFFEPPRAPRILPLPTCELCHLYIWKDAGWVEHSNVVAAKAETD